jgi:hypothetical protein
MDEQSFFAAMHRRAVDNRGLCIGSEHGNLAELPTLEMTVEL